jgi:hypothetical protein
VHIPFFGWCVVVTALSVPSRWSVNVGPISAASPSVVVISAMRSRPSQPVCTPDKPQKQGTSPAAEAGGEGHIAGLRLIVDVDCLRYLENYSSKICRGQENTR